VKRPTVADPEALLTELAADQVEFIVVGGTAAVLHGAPIATQDLDIVHRRTEENVARLMNVLVRLDLGYEYRGPSGFSFLIAFGTTTPAIPAARPLDRPGPSL
jgi:hypothetical protein